MCLPYVRVRVACKMQSDTFDRYTTTSTKLHHKPENERERTAHFEQQQHHVYVYLCMTGVVSNNIKAQVISILSGDLLCVSYMLKWLFNVLSYTNLLEPVN